MVIYLVLLKEISVYAVIGMTEVSLFCIFVEIYMEITIIRIINLFVP